MAKKWRPVLENNSEKESSCTFHDLGTSACLSPGLIDVHTHISALGRDWEGYESATRAACAGGITTCIAMPLNSMPATTTVASFEREREQADKSVLYADVGLWGGAVPRNCNDQDLVLTDLLQAGCWGLKAFLSPLPATAGFESVSPEQLLQAAIVCGQYNKPLLVHAELMSEKECADALGAAFANAGNSESNNPQQSYQAHLDSRPAAWERAAIQVVSEAASSCRMHIVHLSDADSLDVIRTCKADPTKKQLTVETCPHYLLLDSSIIQDGETRVKCFPPIRDAANREKLWEDGIRSGLIDIVASDHSPCTPEMRCMETGNMRLAWGGLSGLQYQLPATWTEAFARGFSVVDMAQWWSRNPSLMAGLEQKGSIAPGKQADLCWWDPSFEGAAPNEYSREYHRWKDTTYYADNSTLRGRVLGTWVRGVHAYDGHQDKHLKAAGEFLVG
jgi:allantoinase